MQNGNVTDTASVTAEVNFFDLGSVFIGVIGISGGVGLLYIANCREDITNS